MKIYINQKLTDLQRKKLFERKIKSFDDINSIVKPIMEDVKKNGDKAVEKYNLQFDNNKSFVISINELQSAALKIEPKLKKAIDTAYKQIYKFHKKQLPKEIKVESIKGVKCSRKYLPIENVGLYIPGGNAVLVSTMLMLGIPAQIAGCNRKVVCSVVKTDKIESGLAYSAIKCGIDEFYSVGGAQAIAMMGYGTKKVKKVDKIFGPGNQFVTAAKSYISNDYNGCLIDMPAGPSEVLIIADKNANPNFIAADLLSQAEHGNDSQVILLTDSKKLAEEVNTSINEQIKNLPRKQFANKSLANSFCLVVENLDEAIQLSNKYAPEHLIINTKDAEGLSKKVINAGSVFIGEYSPESAGDYSSGTNHSLPTFGYAKSVGGVTVEMFMKTVTFQNLSKEGLRKLKDTIITLAETEKLTAHANAVRVRFEDGN